MRILAADTSSGRTALALLFAENAETLEISSVAETPSAARFFVLLSALLSSARVSFHDIDCLALGAGPGSFTGLRVSFAAFRTLAWTQKLPLYPVNSLRALAWPYRAFPALLVVRKEARRGYVYQCVFREGLCVDEIALLSCEEARFRAAAFPDEQKFLLGFDGDEAEFPCLAALPGPDAASIAHLALEAYKIGSPPKLEDVLPLYLRPSDAEMSLQKS